MALPVRMRTRSAGISGRMRCSVSAMSGRSLARGSSCLGCRGVETGQKREPTPPARITAQSSVREELIDAGEKFFGAERLGEKVGCTEAGRALAVRVLSLAGQHD